MKIILKRNKTDLVMIEMYCIYSSGKMQLMAVVHEDCFPHFNGIQNIKLDSKEGLGATLTVGN